MIYFVNNSKIVLNQNDFVASGGEGNLYGKGNLLYKIYSNQQNTISSGKIRELTKLKNKSIIIPEQLVMDDKGKETGFTMRWMKNTIALCKLFTNDFRSKNNIKNDLIIKLIEKMKQIIEFIHKNNCLIVDGNEFNYLVSSDFKEPFFIDVDSYQTPTYSATVIMPSIQDLHSTSFNELTDWFSFAIISCQLFIGIHPFKGRHLKYKNLEQRMLNNVSVFNPSVTIPAQVRDFSNIPQNYYDWFIALFEKGERILPPDTTGAINVVMKQVKQNNVLNKLSIILIKEYEREILYHKFNRNDEIIKIVHGIYINDKQYDCKLTEEMILTDRKRIPILIDIVNNKLVYKSLNQMYDIKSNGGDITCTDKMIIENTIYVKSEDKIFELLFNDFGSDCWISLKNAWKIMSNSSIFFSHVIYQNVLGRSYLVIPSPNNFGLNSYCFYIQTSELDGFKIIDAKYNNKICIVIGSKKGIYTRFIFRFDENHQKYDCRIINDITYLEINFIVKDNGVVVLIIEDQTIEVFYNKIFDNQLNEVKNLNLPLPLKLCQDGNTTLFFKDNKLNKMKIK